MKLRPLGVIIFFLLGAAFALAWAWRRQQSLARYRNLIPRVSMERVEPAVARRIDSLAGIVRNRPLAAEAWGELGKALHIHQFQGAAVACYRQAAELDKHAWPWRYLLAMALQTLGRDDEALEAYAGCLALKGDYAPIPVRLGQVLAGMGRMPAAEAAFQAALRLGGAEYPARIGLAQTSMAAGNWIAAREHLDKARAFAPDGAEAVTLLAEYHLRRGEVGKAGELRSLAAGMHSNGPMPDSVADSLVAAGVSSFWLEHKGRQAQARGRYEPAAMHFRAALSQKPAPGTFNLLAGALLNLGRTDEAVSVLQDATERFPAAAELWNSLGGAYSVQNRPEQAIVGFGRALQADSASLQAYLNLGQLYISLGRSREAIELFRDARRRNPADPNLMRMLALALVTDDRREPKALREALELAAKAAADTGFKDPLAMDVLASAYATSGRFHEAKETQFRALQLISRDGNSGLIASFSERLASYQAMAGAP